MPALHTIHIVQSQNEDETDAIAVSFILDGVDLTGVISNLFPKTYIVNWLHFVIDHVAEI